jgi:hypothetical protein
MNMHIIPIATDAAQEKPKRLAGGGGYDCGSSATNVRRVRRHTVAKNLAPQYDHSWPKADAHRRMPAKRSETC